MTALQTVPINALSKIKIKQPAKQGGTYPAVALGMGVTAQIIDVTPRLAEKWLEKRQVQRKQRKHLVNMLGRLIIAGQWRFNGQAIIFNDKDELADGQHRLAAIANSGKTCICLVLYNVPGEAFETMDSGAARTTADALSASGYNRSLGLAAAAGLLYKYEHGITLGHAAMKLSPLEISDLVRENPKLQDALTEAAQSFHVCRSVGVPTFCYYLFSRINAKACEAFFEKLASGEELSKGHPILELRRKLIARPATERTNHEVLSHWLFKTWNSVRQNKPVELLRIGDKEELPKLI